MFPVNFDKFLRAPFLAEHIRVTASKIMSFTLKMHIHLARITLPCIYSILVKVDVFHMICKSTEINAFSVRFDFLINSFFYLGYTLL